MQGSFNGSSGAGSTQATPNTPSTHANQAQTTTRGSQSSSSPTTAGGDVHEMLAAMQAEMSNLKGAASKAQGESAHARKTLERLQKALGGEESQEEQPQWFDNVLGELLEARQRGMDMPITSQLAVELHKSQQRQAELEKQLERLQGKTEYLADPDTQVDVRAYDQMDSFLGESLENVFGGEYPPGMADSVSKSIVTWLKQLKTESPEEWRELRRNPQNQRKVVQHFVDKHIPAHLRKMQANLIEQQQPFTHEDALEAYQEAMQLPAEQRAKVMPMVRSKIWETMYTKKNQRFNRG